MNSTPNPYARALSQMYPTELAVFLIGVAVGFLEREHLFDRVASLISRMIN